MHYPVPTLLWLGLPADGARKGKEHHPRLHASCASSTLHCHKSSLSGLLACLQIMGQEEVKSFISEHIQAEMGVRFLQGRCRCKPKGHVWKDLLDSISELLTHHLQQVGGSSTACDTLLVHICTK